MPPTSWPGSQFPHVGEQDLYPPGLPHIPPLGPFGGGRPGDGSLIGPNHPAFWPGGHPPGQPQRPSDLPPGARFDPYGALVREDRAPNCNSELRSWQARRAYPVSSPAVSAVSAGRNKV